MSAPEVPNRTLGRGLAMLELLGNHPEGLALFELAERLNLPRSTAFNLARTLTDLDYAWFNAENNRYSLGLRMFEVGSAAINRIDIMSVIRSCMTEIYQQINETMHLAILCDRDVLYIDKIESTRSVHMSSHVGSRKPLYCTALGKAILAGMADQQVRTLYRKTPLAAITEHTITSMPELLRQLSIIRDRGYATERDENDRGVCCAAVFLRDEEGQPKYAISVSAPSFRAGEEDVERYGRMLIDAKAKIERFSRAKNARAFHQDQEEEHHEHL